MPQCWRQREMVEFMKGIKRDLGTEAALLELTDWSTPDKALVVDVRGPF